MGQYWKAVNLDKREYLNPGKLGSGLKLWEQIANLPGVPVALTILMACMPEPRGGGDLDVPASEERVVGRWAGDRVLLVGDYSEDADLPNSPIPLSKVYDLCHEESEGAFKDVSDLVIPVIEQALDGRFVKNNWGNSWYAKDELPEAVAETLTGEKAP